MKLLDTILTHKALLLERPTWLVTCVLLRRQPFGTVSTETRYKLAATNETEAREAVQAYLRDSHPLCTLQSMSVTRLKADLHA